MVGSSFTIPDGKVKVNYRPLMFNVGIQKIIKEIICLDLFLGIGAGNDNSPTHANSFVYFEGQHPELFKTSARTSLAFKTGIKIGILFR